MINGYNPDNWNEEAIADHEKKMVELLESDIDSEFEIELNGNGSSTNSENKALKWFNNYKDDPSGKILLARALLCFGDIANDCGYTNEGEKYNLFDWDKIKIGDAYKAFKKYNLSPVRKKTSSKLKYSAPHLETSGLIKYHHLRGVFARLGV